MTRTSQHSRNKEGEASVDCGRVKAHRAAQAQDVAERAKTVVRVGQVVQHARANHQVESAPKLPDPLDRELMRFEILEIVLALKLARVAKALYEPKNLVCVAPSTKRPTSETDTLPVPGPNSTRLPLTTKPPSNWPALNLIFGSALPHASASQIIKLAACAGTADHAPKTEIATAAAAQKLVRVIALSPVSTEQE